MIHSGICIPIQRETDRQRERGTDRQRERERVTDRQKECVCVWGGGYHFLLIFLGAAWLRR